LLKLTTEALLTVRAEILACSGELFRLMVWRWLQYSAHTAWKPTKRDSNNRNCHFHCHYPTSL